jgi:small subunit ribosomal protein S2
MSEAFTMKELLEAGVHFGHQVRRWNPKMKKYIYSKRSGIHIIDLQKTVRMANQVYNIMKDMASQNKKFLFVCTKKQGNESIQEAAIRCGMPYMIKRWPGGLLTNSEGVRNSIKKLRRIDRMEADGSLLKLTKKERLNLLKQKEKIEGLFGGVKDLDKLPDALVVFDTVREKIALVEAQKLGIPTFALIDTNSDPDLVTYKVPANDDAIRAIKLFVDKFSQAINEGIAESTGGEQVGVEAIQTLREEETLESEKPPISEDAVEQEVQENNV